MRRRLVKEKEPEIVAVLDTSFLEEIRVILGVSSQMKDLLLQCAESTDLNEMQQLWRQYGCQLHQQRLKVKKWLFALRGPSFGRGCEIEPPQEASIDSFQQNEWPAELALLSYLQQARRLVRLEIASYRIVLQRIARLETQPGILLFQQNLAQQEALAETITRQMRQLAIQLRPE